MTVAVIAFTRRGAALGKTLAAALGGTLAAPARFAADVGAEPVPSLDAWTAAQWGEGRGADLRGGGGHRRAGHRPPCEG